jgi:exosortase/archaeosortase family protein
MTLVTLAVVFAYFTHPEGGDREGGGRLSRYASLRSALIVLAAVPIAIITNAGRVSGTGVLSHYYGTEVADGFFHSFSGWVVYVIAFLLLFGFGWVLDRFNPSRRGGPGAGGGAEEKVSGAEAQTDAVGDAPTVAGGTVAVGGGATLGISSHDG